jgi:leucine dehydrogenase
MYVSERHKVVTTRLSVANHPEYDGHEEVLYCQDAASGLRAIVAVHDTSLGPALGGCRMQPYATLDEALTDVLRLSRGMSYKHALAGTNQGGGKAIIFGDPMSDKSFDLAYAFGEFVHKLAGRYITAEDVGMSVDDIAIIREATPYAAGLPIEMGGSGDPSPMTAYGVYCGILAAVEFRNCDVLDGASPLKGCRVAVQGLGKVGSELCRLLSLGGVDLIVSDVNAASISRISESCDAKTCDPGDIYDVNADVFAPCALGAVLNSSTADRLKVAIVAGAANNQLADPETATLLKDRNILYAPDYVVNAGGIINIANEMGGYDVSEAFTQTSRIRNRLTDIFIEAAANNVNTAEVADRMARRRLRLQNDAHSSSTAVNMR